MPFKLDPRNARRHPDRNKEAIRASLEEVGPFRSIAIDGEDIVRAGNGVYEQAQALGLKVRVVEAAADELIAVRRADLTGEKAVRAAVLDNAVGESSEWDPDVLRWLKENQPGAVKGLWTADDWRELVGGNGKEKEDPGAQVDRADELLQKWGVKTGDLFEIGQHRLICGDCTVRGVVERVMGGEKAEIIYTDPPYGYDKGIAGDENIENAIGVYLPAMKLAPVAEDAWAIVDTPKKYIDDFMGASKAAGWKAREPVLSMYRNSMANGVYGTNIFELSFVYSKGNPKVNHRHLNGIDLARKGGHDNLHPTQKFLEAYEHFIELFAHSGATIYDPFLGSGTTLAACERLNRRGRGIEISPSYCSVALERLSQMGLTPRLLMDAPPPHGHS